MSQKTDKEELLKDVLGEAAPADFREALLGQALRVVGRRRRFRRVRNAAVVLAALALLGIFVWQKEVKQTSIATASPSKKTVEPGYTLISTRPLSSGEIVTTRSLATVQLITSKPTVEVVETTTGNFRLINDQELLALVAAHPAALVRTGPNSEKLIFANPADAKDFLAN